MPIKTRSMTKSVSQEKKINVKSKPKASKVRIQTIIEPQNISKMHTEVIMKDALTGVTTKPGKPPVDILTGSELFARGLTLTPICSRGNYWRKVVPVTKTELFNLERADDLRGKWAVAPDGWCWRARSGKCYFWFDWFELEKM